MSEQCSICCDDYTAVLRKPVKCPYCSYEACNVCLKKYLTSGTLDPHCMSCKREWNDDFIDATFTRAFRIGVYKKHREDILVEREISILPTRQPRVEATIKLNKACDVMNEFIKQVDVLERARREIYGKQTRVRAEITRYTAESEGRTPPAWTLTVGEKAATPERAKFIMKCPDGECRGFLSTAYKCGTCQKWACPDCLVIKGENKDDPHTCDPGQKESVALIIKESKPCPKCGERISKIDGCDQMYCVECNTAFSWTTGQLVNGVIHNPHYYEYLRNINNGVAPRNLGDVPCGGIPHYAHLERSLRNLTVEPRRFLLGVHRITSEISDQHMNQFQGNFNVNDNGDLGVKYLMKVISKDTLKAELVKREVKRNKHLAIRSVLEMFVNTSITLLNNLTGDAVKGDSDVNTLVLEFRNLRKYVNDALMNVSRMKHCSVPQLSDTWTWKPFNKIGPKPKKGASTTVTPAKTVLAARTFAESESDSE